MAGSAFSPSSFPLSYTPFSLLFLWQPLGERQDTDAQVWAQYTGTKHIAAVTLNLLTDPPGATQERREAGRAWFTHDVSVLNTI